MVEQRTFNPFVVGSTPAGPTKFKPRQCYVDGVFCYGELGFIAHMIEDIKKTLWATADKLRANMDVAEYKHIVLSLIFVKYISDTLLLV